MNQAIILAGGTGQRMRTSGLPKQFLMVYNKPVIIYTIEKFVLCNDIDMIAIVCNPQYIDYMQDILSKYSFMKKIIITPGGKDRQGSVLNGINAIIQNGGQQDDIIVIHDGVRPLVEQATISENISVAKKYGCAMTVKPVIESVIITDENSSSFKDFKKRDSTYSLTSPQTFKLSILEKVYKEVQDVITPIPLLDAALAYAYLGNKIPIVKEYNHNIKITTAEDYYFFKALLELQENKNVFGLI
mgnify:FL=1